MAVKDSDNIADHPFTVMASVILDALIKKNEAGKATDQQIERPSQLAAEIKASDHLVSLHFLNELPKHCSMLAMAIQDSCRALEALDRSMPFSSTVLARGLMEAAADLYWLADARIDRFERARRTFLVYLIQVETRVRQLEQYRDRRPTKDKELDKKLSEGNLDEAIIEGWQSLQETAEEMASAGYRLRESNRPGARYFLGKRKPSISSLVDKMMRDLQGGATYLNFYSLYSSTAHVEGEGLGTLETRRICLIQKRGQNLRTLIVQSSGKRGSLARWFKLQWVLLGCG